MGCKVALGFFFPKVREQSELIRGRAGNLLKSNVQKNDHPLSTLVHFCMKLLDQYTMVVPPMFVDVLESSICSR